MSDDALTIRAMHEQIESLAQGGLPEPVAVPEGTDGEIAGLCASLNGLITAFRDAQGFVTALANGKLDVAPPYHNQLVSRFKQLHANLMHLTWQTKQIAAGDYSQRVHFMGDFAEAFNTMIEALAEKKRVEDSLREALETVRQLQGIIPICMYCKKIRNDNDYWDKLENYLTAHAEVEFSHGICPECFEARYGER